MANYAKIVARVAPIAQAIPRRTSVRRAEVLSTHVQAWDIALR